MELKVTRQIKSDLSTIGRFAVNGKDTCWTLEPKDRGLTSAMTLETIEDVKIPGKTAIPTGRYRVEKYFSPDHHRDVPHVLNVPGFGYVEIHKGNFPKDTLACLLLGMERGTDMVLESALAINAFYPQFDAAINAGEEVWITYE